TPSQPPVRPVGPGRTSLASDSAGGRRVIVPDGTYSTVSQLAKWYQTCFDSNGMLTTANNAHCKFSVLPADLKLIP
ncbi:MAG TPA: hypothetical protein VFL12_08420, partial [Thermoanaerobaculia bacterium]|nr:hypothetical protein [Thermoanaerobaculia bacterium]